jgi:hypothetical protein
MKSTESYAKQAAIRLDRRVSNRLMARFRRFLPGVLIQRALREARELAAESGYPMLSFPVLAEELVERMKAVAVPGAFGLAEAA